MMTKDLTEPTPAPLRGLTAAEMRQTGGGTMPGVHKVPDVTLKRGQI